MQLDPRTMKQESTYKLLIGCVVPRPIAWVSTVGPDGVNNLAPFSFFMGVCGDPPTIAFSSGPRAKDRKDTVRNAEHTGDFVVNEVDEFALTGLTAAPGVRVRSPRVVEAPISLECRVAQIIPVGHGPHSLVLGEILYFHVRDDLYETATGRIDMTRLRPVGRLAGHAYTHVHDIFQMKRPSETYAG